uniref:Uncharacterized protein n=1 Tax=Lygus hesperus TaxID=30085 RepID=A0A0A9XSS6_LYGHE
MYGESFSSTGNSCYSSTIMRSRKQSGYFAKVVQITVASSLSIPRWTYRLIISSISMFISTPISHCSRARSDLLLSISARDDSASPNPMDRPSANRCAIPIISIIYGDYSAPFTDVTVANVVMIPSYPPYTHAFKYDPVIAWWSSTCAASAKEGVLATMLTQPHTY